ncbi:MAG: serine/threonine-protein kinase [Kofleriaceae bacterium]
MTIPAGTLVPRDAREFGRYELIAKLATGGMAEIYLARRQGSSKREVSVLKRILPHLAEDDHFVTMFRDEAELASKLLHPNVCRVDALDHHGGTWFIEMEYLHGIALSRIMTQLARVNKVMDARLVTGIILQACEGLHHAHELRDANDQLLNVVHRDVSPPNIMITDTGVVKLLDFGIAKARGANSKTRTGTVKGKNAYMSPEQILGRALDRRSDLFALGTVMYELLAIKRLFQRDSDFLTFKAITEEPIPDVRDRRPDLPPALCSVITQALARDPLGRFGTAKALADAIRSAMAPLGGPASRAELARFLAAEFAEELATRGEILAAADELAAAVPTTMGTEPTGRVLLPQSTAAASGPVPTPPPRPRHTPPISNWPPSTNLQEPIDGELSVPVSQLAEHFQVGSSPSVPSMIVKEPSVPMPMLPDPDASDPAFGISAGDGGTDLLRAYRRRSVLRFLLIGGVIAGLIGAGLWWKSNATPPPREPPKQPNKVAAPPVDAAPLAATQPDATPPDAGISDEERRRREIIERSKYCKYSIDATVPATVYANDKKLGETPLLNYPLPPGKYVIKLVTLTAPVKVRRLDIVVMGGGTTNSGVIDLSAPEP